MYGYCEDIFDRGHNCLFSLVFVCQKREEFGVPVITTTQVTPSV